MMKLILIIFDFEKVFVKDNFPKALPYNQYITSVTKQCMLNIV